MKSITKFSIVLLFCVFLFTTGCEQVLTGIGIGAASNEILDTYEETLETKRTELDEAYDLAIANMQAATDPNTLEFEKKKAKQIQIARIANIGALTVIREIKSDESHEGEGSVNPLYGLIPILGAWGANELRKRISSENKRTKDKHGRELALRELAAMDAKDITAPLVKEKLYKAIGDAKV